MAALLLIADHMPFPKTHRMSKQMFPRDDSG